MTFSEVLEALKHGKRARRPYESKNDNLLIRIIWPEKDSEPTAPYLCIERWTEEETPVLEWRVPWSASNTDVLSNDWEII